MRKPLRQLLDPYTIFFLIAFSVLVLLALRRFEQWRLEIGMAGGFIVFAVVLWKILAVHLNADSYEEKKDFVDVHAKILGGAALIVSLIFTWQGIKQNQATSDATQRMSILTLQNSERHQLEDRLSHALEQLGNEKKEARLGAIYSLGKIASDSIDIQSRFEDMKRLIHPTSSDDPLLSSPADLHWPIMQTLSSYIRDNSPRIQGGNGVSNPNSTNTSTRQTFANPLCVKVSNPVSTDIQAALNVIGWRKRSYGNGEDQRLELYETNLRGAILKKIEGSPNNPVGEGAHFEGIQLWGVDLECANLSGIHLEEAILDHSSLKNAYLYEAHFSKNSSLAETDLDGTDLSQATGLNRKIICLAKNWKKNKLPANVQNELDEKPCD